MRVAAVLVPFPRLPGAPDRRDDLKTCICFQNASPIAGGGKEQHERCTTLEGCNENIVD